VTIDIRRAGPSDLATLLELVAEYCDVDAHTFDTATATAGVEPLLHDDRYGTIWMAHDDDRPEGYAAVTWGWSLEIGGLDVVLDEIYVRHRGRGTGSRLLRALELDCRHRDAKRIFLETELPNDGARRLYARHGYTADTSIWTAKELC
jgi:GNAT superfamily N-acetyltransferase